MWPVETDGMLATALKALDLLIIEVKFNLHRGNYSIPPPLRLTSGGLWAQDEHLSSQWTLQSLPKRVTDILFSTLMDLPQLFDSNATIELSHCHLHKMLTTEYIEDGEWCAIWRVSPTRSDPTGIFTFSICSIDNETGVIVLRSSENKLNHDISTFIEIEVKKGSGLSLISEQMLYLPAAPSVPPVPFQGFLTPYGFVGVVVEDCEVWYWIWKYDSLE